MPLLIIPLELSISLTSALKLASMFSEPSMVGLIFNFTPYGFHSTLAEPSLFVVAYGISPPAKKLASSPLIVNSFGFDKILAFPLLINNWTLAVKESRVKEPSDKSDGGLFSDIVMLFGVVDDALFEVVTEPQLSPAPRQDFGCKFSRAS